MGPDLTQAEAVNSNIVVTCVRAAKRRCSCPALFMTIKDSRSVDSIVGKHRSKLPG